MPEEGIDIVFIDREFNRAIDQLADESVRDDVEVLTGQAIHLVRALVFHTRLALKKKGKVVRFRLRGRARAGWWPSWLQLGVFSRPFGTSPEVLSAPEGLFIDKRHKRNEPSVEMVNEVKYIEKLDAKDNILTKAYSQRMADMLRALTDKYRKRLRRHSAFS